LVALIRRAKASYLIHFLKQAKIVIEPSAAVGPAVAFWNTDFGKVEGIQNIGVVICGGNTDLDNLPWIKKV
jgi:threonine dehydratase